MSGGLNSQALLDVIQERGRQVAGEGFTLAHDDGHAAGDLTSAAFCYLHRANWELSDGSYPVGRMDNALTQAIVADYWPKDWDISSWKPTTARRDLVKAAALIIAEIERMDRAAEKASVA